MLVELLDRGQRLDQEGITLGADEGALIIGIVLVVDVADDFFQDILDGDQAGYTAVLIDHDRHVQMRAAEFLEQDVQALAFRNELGRAQQGAQVELLAPVEGMGEQILDDQDADHMVPALVDHRQARMTGFDDRGNQALQAPVLFQNHHLRPRHHHIAHLQLRNFHDAFHHGQGVGVQQFPLLRVAQHLHQLVTVLRLAHQGQA